MSVSTEGITLFVSVTTLTHNWAGQQVDSVCNEVKYTSDIIWPYLLVFDLMLGELNCDDLFSTHVPLLSWRHMQGQRGLCFTDTWIFLLNYFLALTYWWITCVVDMPSCLRKEGSTLLLISLDIMLRSHQKPLQYMKTSYSFSRKNL